MFVKQKKKKKPMRKLQIGENEVEHVPKNQISDNRDTQIQRLARDANN